MRHLPRQLPCVVGLVPAFDPYEDGETGADLAGHGAVDGDSGFGDPLTNRPHRSPIISATPRPKRVAFSVCTRTRARPHPGGGLTHHPLRWTLAAICAQVTRPTAPDLHQ